MLIVLTTHPIQYQVPLWQTLAADGRIPFEVWYVTHHGVQRSPDREFGNTFAWDLNMLDGYPHRLLPSARGATPASFRDCRLTMPLAPMLREVKARAVWIQGWQVLAYWQAAFSARRAGCELWMRGESNDLAPIQWWKRPARRLALSRLFRRVDRFFCIGSANRRLYRKFGADESRLYSAPYAVDNSRFAAQAESALSQRAAIRRKWGVAEGAFCPLFCGKFIPKKRPQDLVAAARRIQTQVPNTHLLFVGTGALSEALRRSCRVAYSADGGLARLSQTAGGDQPPLASFPGFLNQTEVSQAYVAADCLVLPSDHGETWGLVVNEAMASGLPCLISDHCGCAEDLGVLAPNRIFPLADVSSLAEQLRHIAQTIPRVPSGCLDRFTFSETVDSLAAAYGHATAPRPAYPDLPTEVSTYER